MTTSMRRWLGATATPGETDEHAAAYDDLEGGTGNDVRVSIDEDDNGDEEHGNQRDNRTYVPLRVLHGDDDARSRFAQHLVMVVTDADGNEHQYTANRSPAWTSTPRNGTSYRRIGVVLYAALADRLSDTTHGTTLRALAEAATPTGMLDSVVASVLRTAILPTAGTAAAVCLQGHTCEAELQFQLQTRPRWCARVAASDVCGVPSAAFRPVTYTARGEFVSSMDFGRARQMVPMHDGSATDPSWQWPSQPSQTYERVMTTSVLPDYDTPLATPLSTMIAKPETRPRAVREAVCAAAVALASYHQRRSAAEANVTTGAQVAAWWPVRLDIDTDDGVLLLLRWVLSRAAGTDLSRAYVDAANNDGDTLREVDRIARLMESAPSEFVGRGTAKQQHNDVWLQTQSNHGIVYLLVSLLYRENVVHLARAAGTYMLPSPRYDSGSCWMQLPPEIVGVVSYLLTHVLQPYARAAACTLGDTVLVVRPVAQRNTIRLACELDLRIDGVPVPMPVAPSSDTTSAGQSVPLAPPAAVPTSTPRVAQPSQQESLL